MTHLPTRPNLPQSLAAALAILVVVGASAPASAAGLLIARNSGDPLAVKYHRVDIEAADGTSVTTVEQVFTNHTNRQLEATFLFPLPSDAVLVDFKLLVNGKMKKGEVLPREEAERIYLDIVRSMKDPGLVDWMESGLFRARIFPVPARGEQKIQVTYTQVLPFFDGTYKLVHPLRTPGTASRTLEDFTLTARLQHKTPLKAIYSPSHRVSVGRSGDHKATVGFEQARVALDKDFVLYFGISDADVGVQVFTHRPDPGEPGYFMLLAAPRSVFSQGELPQKAVTFVLDTSGSMEGKKMEQARRALLWALDQLGPRDRFNIVRFSSDVESFAEDLVTASTSHIGEAKRFVKSFEAAGGTAIEAALEEALETRPVDDDMTHLVLFMTDGRPTVGETSTSKILERATAANRHDARVFAFGVGDDVDTKLLDRLAGKHHGTSAYVGADDDLEVKTSALYTQLSHPVLTNLDLDIQHVRAHAMLPGQLPDLFKGGQLMLVGRYRGDGHALVRLKGRMQGKQRTWDFEVPFAEKATDNAFVAPIWAHRQVGLLLDQIRLNGETAALRSEVVQLATRFGIVTPYTSYLVVEDDRMLGQPGTSRRNRPLLNTVRTGAAPPAPTLDGAMGREEAESSLRDLFGGRGRAADSGSSTRPAASPRAGSGGGGFAKKSSGRQAVEEAKVVRHFKSKKTANSDVRGVRYVAGRVMRLLGGIWTDEAATSGKRELRVEPYSAAWLEIRRLQPDLGPILGLGERVKFAVGDVVVIVTSGGKSALTSSDRARLKR